MQEKENIFEIRTKSQTANEMLDKSRRVHEPQLFLGYWMCTDRDVLIGWLSAIKVVLGEEL